MGILALLFGGDDLIPRSLKKKPKFVPYTNGAGNGGGKKKKPFFTRKRLKKTWNRVTFKQTRRNIKKAHRVFKRMRRDYRLLKSQSPHAVARKRGLARMRRRSATRRRSTVKRPAVRRR